MIKFNRSPRCPKCGSDAYITSYEQTIARIGWGDATITPEHLVVTCYLCKYKQQMECKDADRG